MEQAKTILIGAETYPPDINGAAFGHRLATSMSSAATRTRSRS